MKTIEDVIQAYKRSIETGQFEDFDTVWSLEQTCSLISITKTYVGRQAIFDDFLTGVIHQVYATIILHVDDIDIHMIDDDHAYAIFGYHTACVRAATGEPYGIKGLETQIFVKEHDDWRLVHVHYSK